MMRHEALDRHFTANMSCKWEKREAKKHSDYMEVRQMEEDLRPEKEDEKLRLRNFMKNTGG